MDWQPKAWIAATLGFVSPPFGFLYLVKPGFALLYFLLTILMVALDTARLSGAVHLPPAGFQYAWLLMPIASLHCYQLSQTGNVTSKRPWYSRWWGLVSIVGTYCVVVLVARSFIYETYRLPSDSMYPGMENGQILFAKKLGYGNYSAYGISLMRTKPSVPILRGEVLVFRLPTDESISYVKRVIGLPGDHLVFRGRRLTVNGKSVPTTCEKNPAAEFCAENLDGILFDVAYAPDRYDTDFEMAVPQGHYFMMGDNRNNSQDSRFIGPIPAEKIVGRVSYVF